MSTLAEGIVRRSDVRHAGRYGHPLARGPVITSQAKTRLAWPLALLFAYLGAVTIFGKGPTYLGVGTVYWGEVVLVLNLLWLVWRRNWRFLRNVPRLLLLVLFSYITLGAALLASDLRTWGVNAVRDSAIWYYAAFFFIGAALGHDRSLGNRVWSYMRWVWLAALLWRTADILTGESLSNLSPSSGDPQFHLLQGSTSDVNQSLALGALLCFTQRFRFSNRIADVFFRLLAFVGLGLFAVSYGRGTKVAVALGVVALLVVSTGPGSLRTRHFRALLILGVLFAAGLLVVGFADSHVDVSPILGRFQGLGQQAPTGTSYWRLVWWQQLRDEVLSRRPVTGLGFGEPLSIYNPFLRGDDLKARPTRSPHNINVTVFARMGIAGATLWGLTLLLGIGGLMWRCWRGRARGVVYDPVRRGELAFWMTALLVTWVNASFGVLMEGPVLGIPFWFLFGFATARSFRQPAGRRQAPQIQVRFAQV